MTMRTEYRAVCNDNGMPCGPVYSSLYNFALDFDGLTKGHDDSHDHHVEARLVGPWEHVDFGLIDRVLDRENER